MAKHLLFITGTSYQLNQNNLIITVDENKVLSALPIALKCSDCIYSSDKTLHDLESRPTLTSLIAVLHAIPVIIPSLYTQSPDLSKINTTVYLIHRNMYGNRTKDLFFSFDITPNLYRKINWDYFQPVNAIKLFPNFQWSRWAPRIVNSELNK
jgi:hypothetical protein